MSKVTWVLEVDKIEEALLSALAKAINALGMPRHSMKFTPFSYDVIGTEPVVQGPCVVYGAAGVQAYAQRVGWRPGGVDG